MTGLKLADLILSLQGQGNPNVT